MGEFPTIPQAFIGSVAAKVLSELSLYMLLVPFAVPAETMRLFKDYRRTVEFAPHALKELISNLHPNGDCVDIGRGYRSIMPQRNKRARHGIERIDPQPFQHLGLRVPNTHDDAEKLGLEVLEGQKNIFEVELTIMVAFILLIICRQFYLSTLLRADMLEIIRRAYIVPADTREDEDRESVEQTEESSDNIIPTSDPARSETQEAFPMAQPMKAAIYFDSAKGMGAWRILISTRMIKNLRETRRRDAQTLKVLLKKIRRALLILSSLSARVTCFSQGAFKWPFFRRQSQTVK
jgi:hypothetical protein